LDLCEKHRDLVRRVLRMAGRIRRPRLTKKPTGTQGEVHCGSLKDLTQGRIAMIEVRSKRRWLGAAGIAVPWLVLALGSSAPSPSCAASSIQALPTEPKRQQHATDRAGAIAQQNKSSSKQLKTPIALWTTQVVSVPVRGRATMKYLAMAPPNPTAAVVLFAGGNGVLDLQADGTIRTDLKLNFLVRERARFVLQGLFVAVLDADSDHLVSGLNGQIRLGEQHRGDIREVIKSVQAKSGGVPVWLVGTSSGSLSVVNAARKSDHASQSIAGIALASPQTALHTYRGDAVHSCGKNVYNDPTLASITGPVLVVVNANDQCKCSPPGNGSALLDAFSAFPEYLMTFESTAMVSPHPCDARTPHGFLSIESTVVSAIAGWIKRGGAMIPIPKAN
jgi:hypothetical protein